MRSTSAEFVRGIALYLVEVDRAGRVSVSLLDWEGAMPVLSGRWDHRNGTIQDWQPDLLCPVGSATPSLVDAAGATLRVVYDWHPGTLSAAGD